MSLKWDMYFLCQKKQSEKLIDPEKSTKKYLGSAYSALATNIIAFHKMNLLPILISEELLNSSENLEETLNKHSAKYHKSCANKFSSMKLKRKEKAEENEISVSPKKKS